MKASATVCSVVVLALLGSAVVMQRTRVTALGYDLGKANAEALRLEEQNRNFAVELSRARDRTEIDRLVRHYELPLLPPEKKLADVMKADAKNHPVKPKSEAKVERPKK